MITIPDSWPFPQQPIAGPTYEQLAAVASTKPAGTVDRKLANIRACDALAREIDLRRAARAIDAATADLREFNDSFTAPY